jgi:hypothetical protein
MRRWLRSPVLRAVALCGVALSGVGGLASSVGVISAHAAVATRVDPTALPLGDGNVSTSPKVGNVDSCQTRFPNVGGAQAVGPWINTAAKTWNSTTKLAVQGPVSWPNASSSTTVSGGRRV